MTESLSGVPNKQTVARLATNAPKPDESRLLTVMEIAEAAIICWPALERHEQASFLFVTKAQDAKTASLIDAVLQARMERIFKWVEDHCVFKGGVAGTMEMVIMKWWWQALKKEATND